MLDNQEKVVQDENVVNSEESKTESNSESNVTPVESANEEATPNQADEKEIPVENYSDKSLEELLVSFKTVLNNNPVQSVKTAVENIKSEFNKKFGALLAQKKAKFLEEGGNSIDFKFSSPLKSEYNELLFDYKKRRDAYYKEIDTQLNQNLDKRNDVIDSLKSLIENADSTTMYKEFKAIQDKWRAIGPVPKSHYNDTWKTYHHHVERFYDLLNLSNDLRDLDFKYNLEEKLKIIEKAKALANEEDVNYASKELQELHKSWKEDIGPVAKEMREEIWQKFSDATKKIHDRRHEYFKEMRSKFQEIVEKKHEVIKKLNAYDTSSNKTHNDWQKSIKEVEKLRQEYFKAGKLPYNKSEEVWQKFKEATKKFNTAKNTFYKREKNEQQENLKKKMALIEIAESFKDSEDWQMATNAMKKIQADWKKIGHVPRKFSDDIWKKFKSACNHYFDRLNNQKNAVSKEQEKVITAKKAFLENLKETKKESKEEVLEAIDKWRDLGSLPKNSGNLKEKFNKQVDKMLENLSLDKEEVAMLKFTNLIDSYLADNDTRKLVSEQQFIRKKQDEINKEIQQLENNLGFFSNATDDNPLVKNVKNQVEKYRKDLAIWNLKMDYLRKLDF
ncbi:DUF349 domain-containing protein [Polaribacter sp. MED152]|uniref:DUF349 domain-containing protein n=1 Tax=Polaribacter sp. MED152 TaxID=313598 RepID=UPI000068CBC1|nr:DUF349 domain-containing protein [Polaribacter sp. MED152]EAQ41972.1 hypothetical protein MED152_04620 [Polaribacter sp. MED152]